VQATCCGLDWWAILPNGATDTVRRNYVNRRLVEERAIPVFRLSRGSDVYEITSDSIRKRCRAYAVETDSLCVRYRDHHPDAAGEATTTSVDTPPTPPATATTVTDQASPGFGIVIATVALLAAKRDGDQQSDRATTAIRLDRELVRPAVFTAAHGSVGDACGCLEQFPNALGSALADVVADSSRRRGVDGIDDGGGVAADVDVANSIAVGYCRHRLSAGDERSKLNVGARDERRYLPRALDDRPGLLDDVSDGRCLWRRVVRAVPDAPVEPEYQRPAQLGHELPLSAAVSPTAGVCCCTTAVSCVQQN
jgi:hypothetical protein